MPVDTVAFSRAIVSCFEERDILLLYLLSHSKVLYHSNSCILDERIVRPRLRPRDYPPDCERRYHIVQTTIKIQSARVQSELQPYHLTTPP